MKDKYYEKLKMLAKDPNSSLLFWGYEASAILKEVERLHSIIKEVRDYIENNSLYEEDYDYDYEENLVVGPPGDEIARKILLEILDKEKV